LDLTAVVALVGCGSHAAVPDGAPPHDVATPVDTALDAGLDLGKLTPSCFHGGASPILHYDTSTTAQSLFAGATWNDPSVIKVDDQFWMYASSNHGFAGTVEVYRMTSSDGDNWTLDPATPVVGVGAAGAWDAGGIETPAVVRFGGGYHLFYTGYKPPFGMEGATDFRIGHATSADGITWKKSETFVLAPTGTASDFDGVIVGEPGPVVVGGQLALYFTAVGTNAALGNATFQVIGLMTSGDGQTWSTPAEAFAPDQVVYPRTANWVGFSTPNAAVLGGAVHVFTDVANDFGTNNWTQVQLHHAASANGTSGFVQDTTPLHVTTDFTWTAREIRSPAVLLDGTTLHLYFAGDHVDVDPTTWGIGHATCDLAP
jgi:predicted GH43/DUF377 family glycosyl hydrolase